MGMLKTAAMGWWAVLSLTGISLAETFELNTTRGLWQLDNSLAARYTASQGPLVASGFIVGAAPNSQFTTESGAQYLIVNSSSSPFAGLKPTETLRLPNTAGANGPSGAAYTNVWTVVMDVRFPSLSIFTYTNLLQDVVSNSDEGEIFINPARQLQFYGATGPSGAEPVASDPLTANTWYRLAFTSTYDSINDRQILRAYVNGVVTSQTSGGAIYAPRDGKYGLTGNVALFSDNNDETSITHLGALGFWGRALSPDDLTTLGGYSASALAWPGILPSNATPPLPLLTGRILYGDFVGNYTPPTGPALLALANSATSSTTPGAVCNVALDLGVGTIAGFPNHRFGGPVQAAVMANGDLVSRTNASVTYNGAGIDLATTANVNLLRQNLFLTTNGGLFAGTLTILFPAGMTVAPSDKHQRAFDKIAMMNVPLNQSLIPKNAVTFTKQNFPNHERSSGLMFCHTERIPIRFPASSVSFTASNGQFSFSTGGANTPDREQQTVAMRNLISMGSAVKAARIPASNDFYFTGGLQALGTVRFGARVGNISTPHLVDLVLSPPPVNATVGETTTHFPKIPLKWTSLGKILYSSGSVDPGNSSLPSNVASSLTYLRGLQSGNCQGQAAGEVPQPSTVAFSPVGGSWTFTADGGISGQCSGLENGGALAPRWGGYRKSGSDFFAHTITGGNDVCRFLSAGNAVVGSEVAAIPVGERPAALLLSGHASAAGDESVERPGTFEYGQGLTDYPGINIRAFGTYNGRSRLADVQTALYPLAPEAKYYIRPGGVSGRTLTVGAANISLAAYGSNFNLTTLNLAFLDGRNVNSGVAGNVRVNTPNATFFNLDFRKLLFGPQGQLQEATLGANQGLKTLGYWNFQFTPLAIDFPQPKSCPPPDPSVGFVRVSSMAAAIPNLTTKPVTGTLGFYDSDLVTEGSAVGAGHPKISRFEPGGLLTVPGPGLEAWNVNCTSGIYLNQFASSLGASGSLNAGGLMDIPFFQDMPVHLRTASTSGPTVPLLHVRSALSTTGAYDSNHRGTPLGVDVATHNTSPSYHPVASQNWQGIVNFDIPVAFAQGSNTFRSQAPVTDSLLIFQLSEAIPKMTPSHAELLFDGQANVGVEAFLKQVNVSTLLTGAVLPGVQPLVNAVIASTGKLDEVLGDNIHALVRPAVSASAALRADVTFFNSLKSPASRDLQFNLLGGSLTSDMLSVFSSETGPVNGRARADIQQKIDSAKSSLDTARGFLDSAAELVDLAEAVGSFVGNNSPPAPPDDFRLNEVKKLFDRASNDLTTASTALASPLNSALTSAIASAVVTEALNDLRAKWVPTDPAQATELYANATAAEFSAELATALTDRLAGSPFAGAAQQLIRQHLTDVKFVARQAVDESLALATGLLPNAATSPFLSALGSVGGQLGAASIKGYARFKGDSIDELRLDGNATLKVPDDMKFDAFFLLKAVDSTTPGGKCLSDGGAKAEISMGASAKLQWAGQAPLDISLGGKVALGNTGSPVGLCGDLKLIGELDFNEVRMKQLALGFGFGANNYYLYGRAAAKVAAMDVAAGIFVGRTCDLAPILNADPDIGKAVTAANLTPPYTGAAVYVFGGISLMPIIGIPPSCLIDLRVGGGQGFFAFDTPAAIVAGYKTTQSVTGELLCIASVTGQQDTLITGAGTFSGGSPRFVSLAGSSRFTASGEVGIGWLSYTFEKSVGINLKVIPQLDWSVDY